VAVYDLQKRWLSVGSAGQVVVVLQRPSTGDLQQLGTSAGPPLGQAMRRNGLQYGDMDLDLERGDRLIACSMVAIELKNAKGEAFGMERLEDALRRHAELASERLREALLSEMTSFATGWKRSKTT
jgi:serine phosphatase RsbU (regulator of sigma subunit)